MLNTVHFNADSQLAELCALQYGIAGIGEVVLVLQGHYSILSFAKVVLLYWQPSGFSWTRFQEFELETLGKKIGLWKQVHDLKTFRTH